MLKSEKVFVNSATEIVGNPLNTRGVRDKFSPWIVLLSPDCGLESHRALFHMEMSMFSLEYISPSFFSLYLSLKYFASQNNKIKTNIKPKTIRGSGPYLYLVIYKSWLILMPPRAEDQLGQGWHMAQYPNVHRSSALLMNEPVHGPGCAIPKSWVVKMIVWPRKSKVDDIWHLTRSAGYPQCRYRFHLFLISPVLLELFWTRAIAVDWHE